MSAGNAFTNPSSGKIDQQRKILEELEKRKKQLNQSSTGLVSTTSISMNNSNNVTSSMSNSGSVQPSYLSSSVNQTSDSGSAGAGQQQHTLNNNQRAALDVANKSSFGYFIPQDSNFGNLILPVIPRD